MIVLRVEAIQQRSRDRPAGYVEDVLGAGHVVRDSHGNAKEVQLTQAQYDLLVQKYAKTSGPRPGTELAKLLKRFGIEPTPTCACRAKAAQMDAWGPDECSKPERIDEVVAVMRAEAKARNLPFFDAAGRMLVRRAIRNARRAAAS